MRKRPNHDLEREDHDRLAAALGRFTRARVVVSYYDEPEIRALYAGWTIVECPMTKSIVNQGARDASGEAITAPEILIINGPSFTSGGLWAATEEEVGCG